MGVSGMRVLSLGAGVQSSTLLLMAVHGELQIDRAVFADTQWEPAEVYDWLGGLVQVAGHAGIPVDVVTAGNLRDDALGDRAFAAMPLYMVGEDGRAPMGRRQCTYQYKLRPIYRRLRELGATAKRPVDLLMGISLDEFGRMREARVKYVRNRYPLVDRRMTRADCLAWLERHGYSPPPKSACIGCPFTDAGRWREMRDRRPDEFADAVAFDAVIRTSARRTGLAYLHRSLVPLNMVDLSTPQDAGQMELWGCVEGVCGV
jgi:hypothetical protein